MAELDFNVPDLAMRVEKLPPHALDDLPFGAIKLDADGVARVFNRTEARMSGFKSRPALGLDFFLDVAPCMGKPEFRGRIEQAHVQAKDQTNPARSFLTPYAPVVLTLRGPRAAIPLGCISSLLRNGDYTCR